MVPLENELFANNFLREGTGSSISRRDFIMGLGVLLLSGLGHDAVSADGKAPSANLFTHPGLLHTEADFQRMQAKVAANIAPWTDCWKILVANPLASLSRNPNPQVAIYRGDDHVHGQNYSILYNDIAAAYACALCWKVSGDSAYADKAVQYLNAWASTLTKLGGSSEVALAAGIYGYQFANVGEIMRSYQGWSASGLAAFQAMMRNVFYLVNHNFLINHWNTQITHYWANWDLCNIASVLSTGVLCDDENLVNEAITYFTSGGGNGCIKQAVYYVHPGYLGQWQETGRDQGHNTLGIALGGAICEMAWNQGIDLYGFDNNRFLAGAEYVAKANLIQSGTSYFAVPYVSYQNVDVTQTTLSTEGQGAVRPCWALVANHYINRKGLAAPYTKLFVDRISPEGGGGNYGPNSGGYDQLGYGTLTCTREAGKPASAPSGLTGHTSANKVVLSWWGCSNANSYTVKRSTKMVGWFVTVASGITNLLTFTDTPPAGGTYYYLVTAQTDAGESAESNKIEVVTSIQLLVNLPFSEGNGTFAADVSGNGYTGILANGATWAKGRSGAPAAALNGNGAYVALPQNLLTDVSDCTLSVWVFLNTLQIGARIFDFGTGTGRYMMLTPRGKTGVVRFFITVNGFGDQFIDGNAPLPIGQWVHVAVTLAGSLGTLYVNGIPVGSNQSMFLAPFLLGNITQNWLGKSQDAADPYFNGLIADFHLYRGSLNAAQVLDDQTTITTGDVKPPAPSIYISPNPVDSGLEINGIKGEIKSNQLFDIAGRSASSLVFERKGQVYKASVEHLPAGVYVLRIVQANNVVQLKFIKK